MEDKSSSAPLAMTPEKARFIEGESTARAHLYRDLMSDEATAAARLREALGGVPCFLLRAHKPGHVQALMVAMDFLRLGHAGMQLVREFDLYEEAHR